MKATTSSARRERGTAVVEFALVLPLFILLIGGMVDLGRAFYTEVMLTNSAREGARAAMYGNPFIPRATAALGGNVGTPTISQNLSCAGVTTGSVTVTVSVPFAWNFLAPALDLVHAGSALPTSLSSEATMQCGG